MRTTQNVFPLGTKGLLIFIAFLNAFVPLSTDMYLPALPNMVNVLDTTPELTNCTLSFFMFFFAISLLMWGPFTDKYGRKPILYCGVSLYVIGSAICFLSPSIELLIFGRCIQAIGSGAINAVSMAIVKDCYQGLVMERVFAWIQTLTIICPMIAPSLGALLLRFFSWRGLFVAFALCGVIALFLTMFLKETLKPELTTQGSALASFKRIGFVLQNRGYLVLLMVFGVMVMPVMSFLSSSSFIYMDMFSLSAQQYGYFFAFNGLFSLLAPIAYMRFFRKLPRTYFISGSLFCVIIFGALVLFFGNLSPYAFALLYVPITFFGSSIRPAGTMLIMNQMDTDNGTVGSLFGCITLLIGSVSMTLCTLNWSDLTKAVGTISLFTGIFTFSVWLIAIKWKLFKTPTI